MPQPTKSGFLSGSVTKYKIEQVLAEMREYGFEIDSDKPDKRVIYRVHWGGRHPRYWAFFANELVIWWHGVDFGRELQSEGFEKKKVANKSKSTARRK